MEARIRQLEEGSVRRISGTGKAKAKFEKYQGKSEGKQYPDAADSTLPSTSKRKRSEDFSTPVKQEPAEEEEEAVVEETPKQKKKKAKKDAGYSADVSVKQEADESLIEDGGGDGEFLFRFN